MAVLGGTINLPCAYSLDAQNVAPPMRVVPLRNAYARGRTLRRRSRFLKTQPANDGRRVQYRSEVCEVEALDRLWCKKESGPELVSLQ